MSDDRWNTVLVLGGTRSGKSAFAESLVAGAPAVRYVADLRKRSILAVEFSSADRTC
jgi:hypothetical protein